MVHLLRGMPGLLLLLYIFWFALAYKLLDLFPSPRLRGDKGTLEAKQG